MLIDSFPTSAVGGYCTKLQVCKLVLCFELADWNLTLKKKFIIIGDSNVARLPVDHCPELQTDSFPGAKLQHSANLIEKAILVLEPEKIVTSFGFNNRQQRFRIAAIIELQRVRNVADRRLPNTEVFFHLINFAQTIPLYEQVMIEHLNSHIMKNTSHIPPLHLSRPGNVLLGER